jgi:hypothetical protein
MRPSGPAFAAAEVAAVVAAAAVEEDVVVVGAMGRYISRAGCPLLFPLSLFSLLPSLSRSPHPKLPISPPGPVALLSLFYATFFWWRLLRYVTIRRAPSKRNNNNARWCLIFSIFIILSSAINQARGLTGFSPIALIFFKRSLFNFGRMCSYLRMWLKESRIHRNTETDSKERRYKCFSNRFFEKRRERSVPHTTPGYEFNVSPETLV